MMMEIPAAAIMADEFAKYVDFFSIGTNDLTQYTLAVDRLNENISDLYDPKNPAVMRLIKGIIHAAHANGIPCCMCGEMAGDPSVIPLLLDLGLDEFSVSPALIPEVKSFILDY
jgi:phosphotransferase system enzyme I (PtsI)